MKKRRQKFAPRYTRARDAYTKEDAEAKRADHTLEVNLVREVFQSTTCRCFVLKSFSEANFHKSLKFGIWSTTSETSLVLFQVLLKRLLQNPRGCVFLIHLFVIMVHQYAQFQLWEKLKYEGFFHVEWLLVKDVPNYRFTRVKMSNTPTKKSITSCRDCEEVPFEEANEFLSIFTEFDSQTSAWDDFAYYDQLQAKLELKRGLVLPDGTDETDLDPYLAPLQ